MAKQRRRKLAQLQGLKMISEECPTIQVGNEQKTVRMRCLPGGPDSHHWQAYIGGAWFTRACFYLRPGSAKRAGNNWAKRMGYKPKWE